MQTELAVNRQPGFRRGTRRADTPKYLQKYRLTHLGSLQHLSKNEFVLLKMSTFLFARTPSAQCRVVSICAITLCVGICSFNIIVGEKIGWVKS